MAATVPKPVPEGELPLFTFMVELVSMSGVCDGEISTLVVCWLGNDIHTNLPELIDREVRSVDWDGYASDGWI